MRLASIRGSASQKEFAATIGVDKNTWARYERGERAPTAEVLLALGRRGYNSNWILDGHGRPLLDDDQIDVHQEMISAVFLDNIDAQRRRQERIRSVAKSLADFRDQVIPVPYYNVSASMGGGVTNHSERVKEYWPFSHTWLARMGLAEHDLAVIDARGDSMTPTINDGDQLLVDLSRRDLAGDGIYALRIDGELFAKRLRRRIDRAVEVISDNPNYKPELLTPDSGLESEIVGKVVWYGKRV